MSREAVIQQAKTPCLLVKIWFAKAATRHHGSQPTASTGRESRFITVLDSTMLRGGERLLRTQTVAGPLKDMLHMNDLGFLKEMQMLVVMTRVQLREGTSDRCAELFRRTNPDLVKNEDDWLGAKMLFDRNSNTVTVLASWRDAASYNAMSAKPEFQSTMKAFGDLFAGKPEITTNELLVDMAPDSI